MTIRRPLAAAALLALAACRRPEAGDVPDADADQRARTAAKTAADILAAEAAARRPLPRVAAPVVPHPPRVAEPVETLSPEPSDPAGNLAD